MASITLTSPISDIRGSTGGTTFSRNSFGAFMKKRDGKTKKISPAAREQKTRFQTLTNYWSQTLTADEQTSWNTYAQQIFYTNSQGAKYKLNGFHSFLKTNIYRLIAELSILKTGPNEGQVSDQLIVIKSQIWLRPIVQRIDLKSTCFENFPNNTANRIMIVYTARPTRLPKTKNFGTFIFEAAITTLLWGGAPYWEYNITKKIPNLVTNNYLPMKFLQITPDGKVSKPTIINRIISG